MEITWALEALGPSAASTVPYLLTTLRDGDEPTVRTTLRALQRVSFDQRELDPLLEDWSRKGQHTNVVRVVAELQARTAGAERGLVAALGAGDCALRRACVAELERFRGAGPPSVVQLAAALQDQDEQVRYGAARALEGIGHTATQAIPALKHASNDTSVMVQRASARALRVIQGQATD